MLGSTGTGAFRPNQPEVEVNSIEEKKPSPGTGAPKSDWTDYRNHLATADREGHRLWIYPRKPKGRFTTARTWVAALLLIVMFVGPFVRIHGNPLLLINIV